MNPDDLKQIIAESVRASLADNDDVLSREELRELMHDAVVEAMSTLGIDARNPMDVQRDMQFLRELRETSERVKQRTIFVLVGILVTGIAAATWLGLKGLLGQP